MNRATEQQGLALQALSYTAYGHSVDGTGTALGFNGERRSGFLQGYGLGNGNRFYRPALMRFLSPDVLSPFGKGGVNSYAYCQGDPVNLLDPTGGHGVLKRVPGRARQVAVVSPFKASNETVTPELRNGPGKYQYARTVSRETVELSGFGSSKGFGGAIVGGRPVETVAAVKSQGPTIDEVGEYWQNRRHWEHRPGTQPMSLDQMIPNHQRTHSPQITEIETTNAAIREQRQHREIIHTLTASGGDL